MQVDQKLGVWLPSYADRLGIYKDITGAILNFVNKTLFLFANSAFSSCLFFLIAYLFNLLCFSSLLKAVILALHHWVSVLWGHQVMIAADNTTVVAYINKQGGTHSHTLFSHIWNPYPAFPSGVHDFHGQPSQGWAPHGGFPDFGYLDSFRPQAPHQHFGAQGRNFGPPSLGFSLMGPPNNDRCRQHYL